MTPADRFWRHVQRRNRGCWLWMGSLGDLGYGRVKVGGRLRAAHRVAYELAHETDIPPNTIIRQKCGERRCCRPEHLEPLRVVRLTQSQVEAIQTSWRGYKRLSAEYGVHRSRIQQIKLAYRRSYAK